MIVVCMFFFKFDLGDR